MEGAEALLEETPENAGEAAGDTVAATEADRRVAIAATRDPAGGYEDDSADPADSRAPARAR
jgi:hypothetical protein